MGYNKEDQILEWRLGGEERLEVKRRSENRVNVMGEREDGSNKVIRKIVGMRGETR